MRPLVTKTPQDLAAITLGGCTSSHTAPHRTTFHTWFGSMPLPRLLESRFVHDVARIEHLFHCWHGGCWLTGAAPVAVAVATILKSKQFRLATDPVFNISRLGSGIPIPTFPRLTTSSKLVVVVFLSFSRGFVRWCGVVRCGCLSSWTTKKCRKHRIISSPSPHLRHHVSAIRACPRHQPHQPVKDDQAERPLQALRQRRRQEGQGCPC